MWIPLLIVVFVTLLALWLSGPGEVASIKASIGGQISMAQINVGETKVGAVQFFDSSGAAIDETTLTGLTYQWTDPDTTKASIDDPTAAHPHFTGVEATTGMVITAAVTFPPSPKFPQGRMLSGTVTLDVLAAPPGPTPNDAVVSITVNIG